MELTFTKSNQGKDKLSYQGHFYVFDKKNATGERSYWRCENLKNCRARLHLRVEDNALLKLVNEHSHFPIPGRKEVLDKIHSMKEDARLRPQKRPREIVSSIGDLHESQQAQLSSLHSQTQRIQRIKRANVDSIPIPNDTNFDLPHKYTFLEDGQTSMLLWDSGKEDTKRIILFATQKTLNCLKSVRHAFTDSTFKSSPNVFYQTWALHGLFGATTVPLVIGFTSNKTEESYGRIYSKIKEAVPEFSPDSMLLDMENANINAIRRHFPAAEVKICLFHVAQACFRQVQALGLLQAYVGRPEVAEFIRKFPTLAFVPQHRVKEYYDMLLQNMPQDVEGIDAFIHYFEDRYVEKRGNRPADIPINMWNMYDRVNANLPRSNNAIESWHSQVNLMIACSNPTFWKALSFLQTEFKIQETKLNALIRGEAFRQKREDKENEEKIRELVHQFGEREADEYLRVLSYRISKFRR